MAVPRGLPQGDLAVGGRDPACSSRSGKRAEAWQWVASQTNATLPERHALGNRSAWVKSHSATQELCDAGQAT